MFHYKYVTAGSDLSSVVINSSSLPFPIGEDELFVSFFDAMQDRIRTTVEIAISKCIYASLIPRPILSFSLLHAFLTFLVQC